MSFKEEGNRKNLLKNVLDVKRQNLLKNVLDVKRQNHERKQENGLENTKKVLIVQIQRGSHKRPIVQDVKRKKILKKTLQIKK